LGSVNVSVGVSLNDGGNLAVFVDAIAAQAVAARDGHHIFVFVREALHVLKKSLFSTNKVSIAAVKTWRVANKTLSAASRFWSSQPPLWEPLPRFYVLLANVRLS
jgi:hypothetical protein